MVFHGALKTRTTIIQTGKRDITYISPNKVLQPKFTNHPIIISGTVKPEILAQLGINTNETYYLVNQVSHNYQDKYHSDLAKVDPNFPLKESVTNANIDICRGFHIIPESVLLNKINDKIVYLHEKGINLKQEEACLAIIVEMINNAITIPASIYDINKGIWININILCEDLFICKTMAEKKQLIEKAIGKKYDDDGVLIIQSQFIQPTQQPAQSILNAKYVQPIQAAQLTVQQSQVLQTKPLFVVQQLIMPSSSSILPELEPKPFIWPNKPLAPLSEVQLEQQKQFLDTVKQSIVILPSTEERHLPFFVFEEPSGAIIKDEENLKDKKVNLENKKKEYETTYGSTTKDLFSKRSESSPKQSGTRQLGSKPFGFDD